MDLLNVIQKLNIIETWWENTVELLKVKLKKNNIP